MRPLFEILQRIPAWEAAAARHGLSAWVADELAAAGRPVPPGLQDAARAQVASGLKVKRLTLTVLDAFTAAGVVPVPLKGYGLATRLFPTQPLARPSVDVDVFVEPAGLDAASRALTKLGLTAQQVPGVEDLEEEHHHHAFSGPAGLVELHFRLTNSFGRGGFDDASVSSRCTPGTLEGRAVRWLSPEDELLYLATHAANHGFLRLSWLVDLVAFLERFPGLDWPAMHTRARAAGFEVPVATALGLVEAVFGASLPDGARRFARSRGRHLADARVFSLERLLDTRWSSHRLASFMLRLYLVDSAGQGARHLFDGASRYVRQRRGR